MSSAGIESGYKMTEVGVIPEDWKIVDYTHLGAVIDGDRGINYPNASELMNYGDCLFLDANNVTKDGFLFVDCRFISADKDKKLNKGKLSKFDVVLTTRGTIGNFAYFDEKVPFANIRINSGMVILRNSLSIVTNIYHYLILRSSVIASQINRISFGSAQPQLTVKGIGGLKIPFPPSMSEQRSIATILCDVNLMIESLEQLIAKKNQIKQGTMQVLLTGKQRLIGYSSKWVSRTIDEITDCLDNLRIPLNDAQRSKMKGDFPYCGANGILDYINDYCIDDDVILIAEDGGYFDEYASRPIAYKISGKFWVNNHAHILKAKSLFDQDFIFYSLVHKNILSSLASGTRAKLNRSELAKISILMPDDLKEQAAISKIFSELDLEVAILEAKLAKARQIKQGMMHNLLTGKIRLV